MKRLLSFSSLVAMKMLRAIGRKCYTWADQVSWYKFSTFDFVPRPDDIFIVSYPRSGTTWLQMILYQLYTSGDMEFEHISEVIPFFERQQYGVPASTRTLVCPRVFKSHSAFGRGLPIPRDSSAKYVYVARNGQDVAVSYFHFYRTHLGFRGDFSDFLRLFMEGKVQYGSWFTHVSSWWLQGNRPNILLVRYEELATDLEGAIRKIAHFFNLDIATDRLHSIVRKCSFEYMKEYEAKFDHLNEIMWERGVQRNSFIRQGRVEIGGEYFTAEQAAHFKRLVADFPGTRWGRD